MPWTTADDTTSQRGFRGFAAQYHRLFRDAPPPLLAALAMADGDWVATLWRARSIAGGHAAAHAALTAFEDEVCVLLGLPTPTWPTNERSSLRRSESNAALPELAALSAVQRGLLGLQTRTTTISREHLVVGGLLAAGFAARDESDRATGLRVRLCGHALPETLRSAWWGVGLRPPDAMVPGAHRGAITALQQAFGSGVASLVDPESCRPMEEPAALDLLLAGASLRAGLRLSQALRTQSTATEIASTAQREAAA